VSQSDFVSRGQALVAAGQFQEAVKVCRLGLLGRPTTVEGRVVLGQALLALKRFDEVLAEMRVALELDHTSVAAQVLKAEALLRKGDIAPAIEALHKARQGAPGDPRILQLLGEAENGPAQRPAVSHPAVGFVAAGDEDSGSDGFTEPTSLQSPGGARRSSQKRAVKPEPTPPPAVLDIGERTGTVEVDPELEGVELEDDIDFDDLAAPPRAGSPAAIGGARGSVKASRGDEPGTAIGKKPAGKTVPPPRSKPMPSQPPMHVSPAASRAAAPAPARAPAPGALRAPAPAAALPPAAPLPPAPRSPVAAVMPAVAPAPPSQPMMAAQPMLPTQQMMPAQPMPPAQPMMAPPASIAAANRPTIAAPAQQPPMFAEPMGAPAWGSPAVPGVDPRARAAANEPTARPAELDPHILALMSGQPQQPPQHPAVALDQAAGTPPKGAQMKTGMRKTRSRLALVVWIVVGTAVIGGGVFAGFKIRAVRLEKQIVAARERATDLAKADTWKGWRDARDSLAGIVQASPTLPNRAALARTRALIAFEFGDGIADAKADVEALAGQGGLDGQLAAAYLALARSDGKAAKLAADAALAMGADDPEAHYVAGHVALLAGDPMGAVAQLKTAYDKEPRPLYGVGLARAHAAGYDWEDAIGVLDKVLAASPDHPEAAITRAAMLAAAGRIFHGGALGNEIKAQLDRVVTQGKRPLGEQQHGVSPAQVAFGHVVLAEIGFLRGDAKAKNDLKLALAVDLDDQRFAEEITDTLFRMGELALARSAAEKTLKEWATSRRARIALAHVLLAQGRPGDAAELVTKQPDVLALADGLTLRGQALAATGDVEAAAKDFDAALAKVPHHEPALIGRVWLELAVGDVAAATKRISARYNPKTATPALTLVWAAVQRRSTDPAAREAAKIELEKLVNHASGLDLARTQLELARLYRDAGDFRSARPAFSAAAGAGLFDARLEYALLLIDDRDPLGGRETLEGLLKEAGEQPPAQLVIQGARARMLVGDHAHAQELLDLAEKMPAVERWKLDRERGRLALRKSQFPAAAAALTRALDTCGDDAETFLLAADVGVYEKTLADKVKKLAPERLKGRPEAKIVEGKLFLVAEKYAEAEEAYRAAKTALRNEKASPRRLAQADFGLGLVAYIRENTVEALQTFELVMEQDPSLIDTYTFASAVTKDPRRSLQFAQKATQFNPDYPYAWLLAGKAAYRLRDRKALAEAKKRLTQLAPDGDELKELNALR